VHPGHGPGPGVVDRDDAGMGVRASQHLRVQHPAQLHVVGEGRVALDQPQPVHLGLGLPDHDGLRHLGRPDHRGHGRPQAVIGGERQFGAWRLAGRGVPAGQGLDDHRPHRLRLLAAQQRRGSPHRRHDLHVAGLAIEDPGQRVCDLPLVGVRVPLEERLGGEDHGARGVARLQCARIDKSLLDGVQFAGRHVEGLHGGHRVTVGLRRQQHVGGNDPAVQEHAGRARLAGARPEADAEAPLAAKQRQQRLARLAAQPPRGAVKGDGDIH
jgi:hypothetical protein